MVYSFDYLSLNISEFTHPSMIPGKNYQNLLTEQFYSISKEPIMIAPKYRPYMFIFCPRVISQNIANSIPPEPFHPKYILHTTATKETMQSILSLLSRGVSGRQGQSSYFLIIPIQFNKKADKQVTKAYCSTGIPASPEIQKCTMTSRGASKSNAGLLSLILGQSDLSLYQNSQISGCAGLFWRLLLVLSLEFSILSVSNLFQSSDCCLLIYDYSVQATFDLMSLGTKIKMGKPTTKKLILDINLYQNIEEQVMIVCDDSQ